jgi:hypothetical protein
VEIEISRFVEVCKQVGLSEEVTIDLINRLSSKKEKPISSKDIPIKVNNNYTWTNHDSRPDGNCPVCNYDLSGSAKTPKVERCPDCNQLLDWDGPF